MDGMEERERQRLHEMKAIPQEKVRKPKRVQPAPAAYRDSDDEYRSRKKKKPKEHGWGLNM